MSNDLNDTPIAAWIKNEDYPNGHFVYQPASVLQTMKGVEYDLEKVHRLLDARVDVDRPRKLPQYILGQQTADGLINMFSLGNISMIQGQKKARKGFLSGLIVSTLIRKDPDPNSGLYAVPVNLERHVLDPNDFPDIDPEVLQTQTAFKPKNRIVIVDTEQSEDDVIISTKRIMQLSGCPKWQIITLTARENTMAAKAEIMQLELQGRTDILFVLVDGGVDMVNDSNDIAESSSFVRDILLPLSSKLHCHISVVIHENKANKEARGHLGLILGQKAECIIGVELTYGREKTHSTVNCIASRRKQFEPFMFEVRADELPYYVPDEVAPKKEKKSELNQVNMASTTHDNIIRNIFDKAAIAAIPMKRFKELLKIELEGASVKNTGRPSIETWIEYYQTTYKKIVVEGNTSDRAVRQYGVIEPKQISQPKQSVDELF